MSRGSGEGVKMTRHEAINRAAADVATAADFGEVGEVDLFGETITADVVLTAVESAVGRLQRILDTTDAEWATRWAASAAEERRVEDEAWRFAVARE